MLSQKFRTYFDELAEADIKRLCKESKAEDQPTRDPGKAE
jgi:hypothetical protein